MVLFRYYTTTRYDLAEMKALERGAAVHAQNPTTPLFLAPGLGFRIPT